MNYTGSLLEMCEWTFVSNSNYLTASSFNGSIRHAGNLDMSEHGIWLFSNTALSGEEKVITTPASNDITFTPRSLLTTGFSNWTLFTGKNFDGYTTCIVSTWEVEVLYTLNTTLSNIQSVIRGCVGRIDAYVFGDNHNKTVNLSTN